MTGEVRRIALGFLATLVLLGVILVSAELVYFEFVCLIGGGK